MNQGVRAPLAYCRRCDMAFCPMHMDSHWGHASGEVPTIALAEEYGAQFCAVCGGILRAIAPGEDRSAK